MTEPEAPKPEGPTPLADKPKDDVSWRDGAAIGIGCLVFVIFFAAIVLVGIMRGQE